MITSATPVSAPIVSIVIPVFNSAPYLDDCLHSVVGQSIKSFEIICINDGSTDESGKILSAWKKSDQRIKVLSQINKGQSCARNAGLRVAKGDYIYFLDSDDTIKPDSLEKLLTAIKTSDAQVALFDGSTQYENNSLEDKFPHYASAYTKKKRYPGVNTGAELACKMIKNQEYSCSPCLQLIKRNFLLENKIEFYPGIIHEDNLFTYQVLSNAKRAIHLPEQLFIRRVRPNSTVTTPDNEKNFIGAGICDFYISRSIARMDDNTAESLYPRLASQILSRRCARILRNKEVLKKAKLAAGKVKHLPCREHLQKLISLEEHKSLDFFNNFFEKKVLIPSIGFIDSAEEKSSEIIFSGWCLAYSIAKAERFILVSDAHKLEAISCERLERLDIKSIHPDADLDCGFRATFNLPLGGIPSNTKLHGVFGSRILTQSIEKSNTKTSNWTTAILKNGLSKWRSVFSLSRLGNRRCRST